MKGYWEDWVGATQFVSFVSPSKYRSTKWYCSQYIEGDFEMFKINLIILKYE